MKGKATIPGWPHRFFKWYCQREKYEEIHGDLEEFFYERAEEKGLTRARLHYFLDVLRCCQPYAWKKSKSQNSNIIMLRNYFKTSSRNLMKNPLSSFINIFGLSAAIGVCVFIYGFGQWTYRTDQFHENKDEVFLVTFFADRDGAIQQIGKSPRPLASMLKEDFGQITKSCRLERRNAVLKSGDKVFHERIDYVDPEYLEMFTFPLKWGSPGSLKDMNSIILSEAKSIKYFGESNPVGRQLLVKFDQQRSKTFTVSGVAMPFPESRSFTFNFLVNIENFRIAEPGYNFYDWAKYVDAAFIQLDNPDDLGYVKAGLEKYVTLQNQMESDWTIDAFDFVPVADVHFKTEDIRDDIFVSAKDNYTGLIFLGFIGAFILALACFNYINIAIVTAVRRLKEIGLRKVIGASRGMVITQFLTENIFLTFFASLIGLLIGANIFIPWFERMYSFNMGFRYFDMDLLLYLTAILLFTGIVSGIYPALYISKFQTVNIFKGSTKVGRKNRLTKVLLGLQLILACILITSAVMFTQNNFYIAKRSWGYNQKETLYVEVPDRSAFERLSAAVGQNPDVLSVAGSSHHLGRSSAVAVINALDREYEVDQLTVDANYFETMGMTLMEGRTFKAHHEEDKQALVVNELLVQKLGLEDAIGQVLKIDSIRYQVIGVVRNLHTYSFYYAMKPTIFKVAERDEYRFLSVKVREGTEIESYKAVQAAWSSLYPETPFKGGLQEDAWGGYFLDINNHGRFWRGIAYITILLAGLGLYGLVTLNVTGRTKEFSIRKALGARLKNITSNIMSQYMVLFLVAFGIGAPASYMLLDFVLDFAYEYHIPMNSSGIIFSVALLGFVLLTVVGTQAGKIFRSNPVDGLRAE